MKGEEGNQRIRAARYCCEETVITGQRMMGEKKGDGFSMRI
jgi:hypothetical protein